VGVWGLWRGILMALIRTSPMVLSM